MSLLKCFSTDILVQFIYCAPRLGNYYILIIFLDNAVALHLYVMILLLLLFLYLGLSLSRLRILTAYAIENDRLKQGTHWR